MGASPLPNFTGDPASYLGLGISQEQGRVGG